MKKSLRRLLIAVLSLAVMFAMGAVAFANEAPVPSDGTYSVDVTSTLKMFKIKDAQVEVNGENATLIINSTNADRYGEIYLGAYTDITEENKDTIGIKGTVADGIVTFRIPMATADLIALVDAEYQQQFVLRYVDPYINSSGEDYSGVWYKGKNDYYLTLSNLVQTSFPLAITNNTNMFKAVSASVVMEGENTSLVFALSGEGYHELFKGTYEQASANGDGSADKGNDAWMHGYVNAAGRWEFKMPLNADETFIPVVAVSGSYYNKYLNGQNTLERAFYPRQFEVDKEAKTLVTGDYDHTTKIDVANKTAAFNIANTADLHIIGGPNSNAGYKKLLTITMGNDKYDKLNSEEFTFKNFVSTTTGTMITYPITEGKQFVDIPLRPDTATEVTLQLKGKDTAYKAEISIDALGETVTVQGKDLPIKDAAIGAFSARTFTGKALTPAPKVTFNGMTLKKDTDYKVAYKNNTNAGKATVTVTGKGNFTGTKTTTFVINPAAQKLKISAAAKTVKAKALKKKAQFTTKVAVSGAKGKLTYVKVAKGSSKKLTINKTTGKIKVAKKTKKGTYKIKVKVSAAKTKNYKAATATKTIKVVVK